MGVQEAVLSIVADGPGYGYQIVRELEDEWSSAAVYRALRRLRERGLIEPAGIDEPDGRRKHYKLTAAGAELNAARVARLLGSRQDALSTLLRASPNSILAMIDKLEARLLAEIGDEPAEHVDLVSELACAERRFVNEARLRWISVVRAKVGDVAPRT